MSIESHFRLLGVANAEYSDLLHFFPNSSGFVAANLNPANRYLVAFTFSGFTNQVMDLINRTSCSTSSWVNRPFRPLLTSICPLYLENKSNRTPHCPTGKSYSHPSSSHRPHDSLARLYPPHACPRVLRPIGFGKDTGYADTRTHGLESA